LIIPATSAGIERAFSTAGLILNDRRNRLSDEMFEQMLVAKLNDDFIIMTVGKGCCSELTFYFLGRLSISSF